MMERCNTCGIRLDDGLCHCPTVLWMALDKSRLRVQELEAMLTEAAQHLWERGDYCTANRCRLTVSGHEGEPPAKALAPDDGSETEGDGNG